VFKSPAIIKFRNCVKKVMEDIRAKANKKSQMELLMEEIKKMVKSKKEERQKEEEEKRQTDKAFYSSMISKHKDKILRQREEEMNIRQKQTRRTSVFKPFAVSSLQFA